MNSNCTGNKPNIVFIMVDDMGWRDLGCYGSTFYETPCIDKIARQGMTFTDAYAACPVCSPTRASLMSGKYPARVGVTDFISTRVARGKLIDAPYTHHLPITEKSIASALRDGGYSTWHVGKWHLGTEEYWPEHHGFDVNIGGCHMGAPGKGGYFSPYNIPVLSPGPEGEFLTDRLTDGAIDLIKNRNKEKPFFMYMSHYAVHTPIMAKQEDIRRFEEKSHRLGLDKLEAMEEGEYFPCEHKHSQHVIRRRVQSNPVYAALIWNLDWNTGRLMDTLGKEGIADNTIVVFTSDNGGLATAEGSPTCNIPLAEGKGWMYDGGVREPLIVRWPAAVQKGAVCEEPVTTPDFYPTLLEAAGLPLSPEQHMDGKSFLKALQEQPFERGPIFWHYPHYGNQGGTPGASVRDGDYKLLEFFEDGHTELYDIRNDISQVTDLNDVMPEKAVELRKKLHAWFEDVSAVMPMENPDWKE